MAVMNRHTANEIYTLDGWLAQNGNAARSIYDNGFELDEEHFTYRIYAYGRDGELDETPIATFNDKLADWYRREGAILEGRRCLVEARKLLEVSDYLKAADYLADVKDICAAYDITPEELG